MFELNELPSDPYSDYICKNPWRTWSIAMFVIFFFTAVCLAISFTKERPFTLSGATVGFDNRGTPIAGKTLALEHFPKAECTGELSLKADGSFSQYVIIGD